MVKNKELAIKCGLYFYLVLMTIVVSYFSSKVWNIQLWPNERFTVVVISSMSFLILLLGLSIKLKKIQHIFIIYHVSVVLTVILMLVSYEYRPIMAIFMLITLFAGLDTGIISVVSISVAVSFLFSAEQEYLYGTIIIGAVSCLVAYFVKDKIKFIISIIVFLFVTFFINGIFQYYNTEIFDYEFALLSLSSSIISIIVLFNVYLLIKPKSVEPYIKEDAETIKSIREKSLTLFYHSTEVAELSLAGAKAIKCDERLTFGGGLLHDLGKVEGNSDYIKSGLKLANYYGIPKEIKAIMVEHNAKNRIPCSKESAIVMLADTVISSIEYLKASNKEISEKKIIENVFDARLNSNTLDNSDLSLKEYIMIKKAFLDFY